MSKDEGGRGEGSNPKIVGLQTYKESGVKSESTLYRLQISNLRGT